MRNESLASLFTIEDVAYLLRRSPDGLRYTLRRDTPLGRKLRSAVVRIGRHIRFRRDLILELMQEGAAA